MKGVFKMFKCVYCGATFPKTNPPYYEEDGVIEYVCPWCGEELELEDE